MLDLSKDLAWALDPVAFAIDRLGFDPDPWQADLLRSGSRRIAVCAGRQTGKTATTAAKATHKAIYSPGSLILCVAPALRQSQLWFNTATGYLRRLDEAAELLQKDNSLSVTLRNGSQMVALPAEPSRIRGFSAPAMVLVDECAFLSEGANAATNDQRIFSAVTPMLAVSNGQLVIISSANGKVGYFADAFLKGGEEWERYIITVDQCPRITKEFLEAERRSKTEAQFLQEYYCQWSSSDAAFMDFNLVLGARDTSVSPLWNERELTHIAARVGA